MNRNCNFGKSSRRHRPDRPAPPLPLLNVRHLRHYAGSYGADAVRIMTENPYRLARDIRGMGFKTADVIAAKPGIEATAIVRVRAGISYALTEPRDDGHCGPAHGRPDL